MTTPEEPQPCSECGAQIDLDQMTLHLEWHRGPKIDKAKAAQAKAEAATRRANQMAQMDGMDTQRSTDPMAQMDGMQNRPTKPE